MSRIESLTPEQEARMPDYVTEWTAIGLSTEPADRPRAEAAIRLVYERAGLEPPKLIEWCDSPPAMLRRRADVVAQFAPAKERTRAREAALKAGVHDCGYGQHDAEWLAFYAYFAEVCGLREETKALDGLWELAKSAGWILPHQNVCWVSERPTVLLRDAEGRLDADGRHAIEYPDGWGVYAIHGTRLPDYIGAVKRSEWKSEWLLSETNAELRRVLLREIGYSRALLDLGAKQIHADGDMELCEIPAAIDVEPVRLLKVVCPSTGAFYTLRVPTTVTTCESARAWTFREDSIEYVAET